MCLLSENCFPFSLSTHATHCQNTRRGQHGNILLFLKIRFEGAKRSGLGIWFILSSYNFFSDDSNHSPATRLNKVSGMSCDTLRTSTTTLRQQKQPSTTMRGVHEGPLVLRHAPINIASSRIMGMVDNCSYLVTNILQTLPCRAETR